MPGYEELKPIYRSKLRVFLGKRYYRLIRYLDWYFGNKTYAKIKLDGKLEYIAFSHETPIYRKLKNVDMWLQENKAKNLKIALKKVNGVIIRPGETFSFWRCIGRPTRLKGYVKGMNLYYGRSDQI